MSRMESLRYFADASAHLSILKMLLYPHSHDIASTSDTVQARGAYLYRFANIVSKLYCYKAYSSICPAPFIPWFICLNYSILGV